MLPGSISGEGVEPIAPRYPRILETDREIKILELSGGARLRMSGGQRADLPVAYSAWVSRSAKVLSTPGA